MIGYVLWLFNHLNMSIFRLLYPTLFKTEGFTGLTAYMEIK